MLEFEIILFVKDKSRSRIFYENLLQISPSLDVEGMTEFTIMNGVKLGLMPEDGISRLLPGKISHPKEASGIPRCELYLKVEKPIEYISRAIDLGGKILSKYQERDWGDNVAYISDLDGHIIAIALL